MGYRSTESGKSLRTTSIIAALVIGGGIIGGIAGADIVAHQALSGDALGNVFNHPYYTPKFGYYGDALGHELLGMKIGAFLGALATPSITGVGILLAKGLKQR